MSHYTEDKCSECGNYTSPELLTIVRVQFMIKSAPRKVVRSRSIAWKCEKCLSKDEHWNAPAYGGPGNKSEPLESVRRAQNGASSGTV